MEKHFDYIIVGAGSAGCVLAERLSASGRKSVLLLEAGGKNDDLMVRMPRGMVKIWGGQKHYWPFPTEADEGRPTDETWYYGKGLGGSSAVNGTWYFRGQPKDYDSWDEMGLDGWNWSRFEQAYSELECYCGQGDYKMRGHKGPMEITTMDVSSAISRAIIDAGVALGARPVEDVNLPSMPVIGPSQMTVDRKGRRVTAWTAFIEGQSAHKRSNLTVRTSALVHRVLFDGKRATGVLAEIGDTLHSFSGSEIIVCAGVLQSPKLLQLSGIGPADELARLGIDLLVHNAEVGRHMNEHMMISMSWALKNAHGLNREFRGIRLAKHVARYFLNGTGLMASLLPEVSAMMAMNGPSDWPDLQLGISPYSMGAHDGGEKTEAGRGTPDSKPGITVTAFSLRPGSSGEVALRSTDPAAPPILRANWFASEHERECAIDMVRYARRFMAQEPLAQYVGEELLPRGNPQTNDEIFEVAQTMVSTGLHGTGTCRMGQPGTSVVDERLQVHGVEGLRVVDCSAMPTAISGNTNGPVIALAWIAAQIIEEDALSEQP